MLRNWFKGKPSISSETITLSDEVEKHNSSLNESHQMTLNRPFGIEEAAESLSTSIEYHLTARISNESLTRRELSLLLDVLNFQAVYYGINFNMILAMYELYFRILGKNSNSIQEKEPRIRLTLTVSELILKSFGRNEFTLDSSLGYTCPSILRKTLINIGLMSKRTYGSRYRTWRPEKFILIKAVPVDIQFLNRRKGSQPYSSYCKGYGESHPSAHKEKLRPSAELDGDGKDPSLIEEEHLFNRCTDPIHLLSEYLLIWYSREMEKEK
jgi:hypothetical protein